MGRSVLTMNRKIGWTLIKTLFILQLWRCVTAQRSPGDHEDDYRIQKFGYQPNSDMRFGPEYDGYNTIASKRTEPGYNVRLMKRPSPGYNIRLMKMEDEAGYNYNARLMKRSFTDYNKRLMKRFQPEFQPI